LQVQIAAHIGLFRSAGSAACFVCTAKLGRVIESQGQGSSSSGRLLSPSIVSSSHLQSDPVLIGENRELLGAIDSRFNISEVCRLFLYCCPQFTL